MAARPEINCPSSGPEQAGFTFVELLVVIATLAMLAAMLLPALAGTKANTQTLVCMDNKRQITLAWLAYAHDHNDTLCDSRKWLVRDGGNFANPPADPGPDSTNVTLLTGGVLNSYLKGNYQVYKCPGDTRTCNNGQPTLRSVSMQCSIGANPDGSAFWPNNRAYLAYTTLASMNRPGPANLFVILDESVNTINDAWFPFSMDGYDPINPGSYAFVDVPAGYHINAGSLSFADGHSEIHKWVDSRTQTAQMFEPSPNNLDVAWLQDHGTRRATSYTRF